MHKLLMYGAVPCSLVVDPKSIYKCIADTVRTVLTVSQHSSDCVTVRNIYISVLLTLITEATCRGRQGPSGAMCVH
jgi:hypothetical protein